MNTLVIMAAGIGSRFGGQKQLTAVDSIGHSIMDYSVYDAVQVGFNRVIYIINEKTIDRFRLIADDVRSKYGICTDLLVQETDSLPKGRTKPWGTGQAIACLDGMVDSPFAVVNADDFYGRDAFRSLLHILTITGRAESELAMVGYRLKNTLSENGSVSRGLCRVDNGRLVDIHEVLEIVCRGENICSEKEGTSCILDSNNIVSMNLWALTPYFVRECKNRFKAFLEKCNDGDFTSEFYLPGVVCDLLREGRVTVDVVETDSIWQGITYRNDISVVSEYLSSLTYQGIYPMNL